jgi:hypothetical protein
MKQLLRILGVAALLGLLLAQMASSSARKSAAFDETYHLVSGYAYLHTAARASVGSTLPSPRHWPPCRCSPATT